MVSSGDYNYSNFHYIKKYFHANTINPTEDKRDLQLHTSECHQKKAFGVSVERLVWMNRMATLFPYLSFRMQMANIISVHGVDYQPLDPTHLGDFG